MNNSGENKEKTFDYLITHLGDLKFEAKLPNGEIKECGNNLLGMLRYTYFEDFSTPPIGWSTTREQLMKDYFPKLMKDLSEGKISNEINKI
jgi:hypothetical protein